MKNYYQNTITTTEIKSLQKDLKEKRIDQQQFAFLIGFILKNQLNYFIQTNIESLIPENRNESQMTLINYKIDRKLNHV